MVSCSQAAFLDDFVFVCMHVDVNVDVCAYVMSLFQRSH